MRVRRALISVSDKTGVVDFARALVRLGVEIVSTGGTARLLEASGLAVVEVADYTGFPEILNGRVKTLHPKVHGGLLAVHDDPAQRRAMEAHGIAPIDLVCVNLYPFEATVARSEADIAEAIENIDIGGPAMLRSAAKNYRYVAAVTDPAQYPALAAELQGSAGSLSEATRFALAVAAFNRIADYDAAISDYLSAVQPDGTRAEFPGQANGRFVKLKDLRYGENPHQTAALYRELHPAPGTLATFIQRQGKELSYNNLADADAAWECVRQFESSACVIVKHANPCGAALGPDPQTAYRRAFATDPTAAFGGIIAFNRPLDGPAAEAIGAQFVEVVVAPGYREDALAGLARKPNLRALEIPPGEGTNRHDCKRIGGGLLMQTADNLAVRREDLRTVTRIAPTAEQVDDLLFAFRVAKFVKSNAIVFCREGRTLGIGAGQMSRVDATRLAVLKAEAAGLSLARSVAASDAFFPFRDGLDVLARAGAVAVIQPGGSVRDPEVIAAADEHGIAMVMTGIRHFRH